MLKQKIEALSLDERAQLTVALTPRRNKYIPITFTPRQTVFLLLNQVQEVLFGGAAGGAKSWALLAAASQYVDVPGYSALLLRRSYRDLALPGALIPISHEWWDGTDAKWSGQDYAWTFPSGATVQFGYLENEGDEMRYQGAAFHFIGFDELTQFQRHQYLYLFSRLRRPKGDGAGATIPLRIRAASNPGGRGHEWVKERWNLPSGNTGAPNRLFVPSKLDDNPYLDVESYEQALNQLATVTYQQLREGDWDANISGGKFYPEWFTVIDRKDLPPRESWEAIVRHWDLGSQAVTTESPDPDWTAGCKMVRVNQLPKTLNSWFRENNTTPPPPPYYIVLDVARIRSDPGGVEEFVKVTSANDGHWVPVSIEQERGASGKSMVDAYRRHVLQHADKVFGLWAKNSKESRASIAAGRAREGRIFLLAGEWNQPFVNELSLFGVDRVHDDQVDAFSGCFQAFQKLEYTSGQRQAREY